MSGALMTRSELPSARGVSFTTQGSFHPPDPKSPSHPHFVPRTAVTTVPCDLIHFASAGSADLNFARSGKSHTKSKNTKMPAP